MLLFVCLCVYVRVCIRNDGVFYEKLQQNIFQPQTRTYTGRHTQAGFDVVPCSCIHKDRDGNVRKNARPRIEKGQETECFSLSVSFSPSVSLSHSLLFALRVCVCMCRMSVYFLSLYTFLFVCLCVLHFILYADIRYVVCYTFHAQQCRTERLNTMLLNIVHMYGGDWQQIRRESEIPT